MGVCGSVAAVKAPEIAVRLSQSKIDVRILLTKGGRNFWDKASDYNVKYWKLVQEHIETSKSAVIHETYTTNNLEQEGHVHLHGTYCTSSIISCCGKVHYFSPLCLFRRTT